MNQFNSGLANAADQTNGAMNGAMAGATENVASANAAFGATTAGFQD